MIDLTISIVNYNARESLRLCLDSIKRNICGLDYEAIVVDNNSGDGSAEMVKDRYPHVKLIADDRNLGAPAAKNQSFRLAKGRYILILDSDIEILPDSVERMLAFLEDDQKSGIVGPRVVFADRRPQHSCNKKRPGYLSLFLNKVFFFSTIRYFFYRSRLGGVYLNLKYRNAEEFSWLGGMCLLARRELIDQLNGIDEDYFIYYDDVDLCLRAKLTGWKVCHNPKATVIHHMSASVGRFDLAPIIKATCM